MSFIYTMFKHIQRMARKLLQPAQEGEVVYNYYKRFGDCNGCGDCCSGIALVHQQKPIASTAEFERLKKRNKDYRHFVPIEESALGLIFACTHLQADKSCGIHEDRPDFCRKYPNEATMLMGGNLSPDCSYRFEKRFSFEDKLSEAEKPSLLKFSTTGKLLNTTAILKPQSPNPLGD